MRQPWPSFRDSPCRVVQRALVQILALMAALGSGKETSSGRGPTTVDSDLKQRCYSIGTCVPKEEPSGEATVVCAIMERSVRCMAAAADACRQLNFSQQLLDIHDVAVRELTNELKNHCADVMPGIASSLEPGTVTGRSDEDYVEQSEREESEGLEIMDADVLEDDAKSGVRTMSVCGLLTMTLTALLSAILAAQSFARVF